MRPSSLRHEPTETCRPSLKRARHAVKIGYPGRSQTDLHLNGIQMNPQKQGSLRWEEHTLLGVHPEAKRMDVA